MSSLQTHPDVIIVGDGPGGLSAALFIAKGGLKVTVYGQDKTAMNWALLRNYLGIPEILGGEFQVIARKQVAAVGGRIENSRVDSISKGNSGFEVTLEGGARSKARVVVLSEGKSPKLAQQLGLVFDEKAGLQVDMNGKTSIEGLYAVGRLVRPTRSQAIISAGDGAAVAIDILSAIKGAPVQDWDSPTEKG